MSKRLDPFDFQSTFHYIFANKEAKLEKEERTKILTES